MKQFSFIDSCHTVGAVTNIAWFTALSLIMPSLELTTQKAISFRHREKVDEMTFPEQNLFTDTHCLKRTYNTWLIEFPYELIGIFEQRKSLL